MPFYELALILRPMPKNEMIECLKRTAQTIWKENGVLRQIQYLGHQKLPFAARSHEEGLRYHEGSYFLYHISVPQLRLKKIKPELKLDVDIARARFHLANETALPEDYECTLEEELKPPAFRKSVQPLLENKNVRADTRRVHQLNN